MRYFSSLLALVELPLLVYGVRYLGGRWQEILALVQRFQGFLLPGLVLLALGLWLYSRRRSKSAGSGR